ncbi:hypothetical protein J4526_04840 [Desulfurococcaceae archaeon MEX13E-LK6-19]|nr:hypothetical protein J4526_04840 [Desulfurococcaceae archaeon MEX13E-LK6-19]
MSEPRFVVDTMLGNVARWLRLLGYDVIYGRKLEDWKILMIADKEDRIILTRDRGLHHRALSKGLKSILLEQDTMEERLAYLALKTGIRLYVDIEKSRCPICNGELVKVGKDVVKGRVPPRVYEKHSDFWVCKKCGKIYWMGRHWKGIEETLKRAREILEEMEQRRIKIVGTKTNSSQ